jgi:hypothetical protein
MLRWLCMPVWSKNPISMKPNSAISKMRDKDGIHCEFEERPRPVPHIASPHPRESIRRYTPASKAACVSCCFCLARRSSFSRALATFNTSASYLSLIFVDSAVDVYRKRAVLLPPKSPV